MRAMRAGKRDKIWDPDGSPFTVPRRIRNSPGVIQGILPIVTLGVP